ncbi:MAG: hypothetical protein JNK82_36500 [Myxococcaceae bacterium]|nr:hypothetical protein [Myxococcaceae bacterium]
MDITEGVVTVLVVTIVVGLPMSALCLRFALKPTIEAWLKLREASLRPAPTPAQAELEGLKLRVAALEAVWETRLGAGTLERSQPPRLVD